jgi:hypothetical protein
VANASGRPIGWRMELLTRMPENPKVPTYYVRGTAPTNDQQVVFECEGSAMAHAKAAELRMSGYRDVVTSIRAEPSPSA